MFIPKGSAGGDVKVAMRGGKGQVVFNTLVPADALPSKSRLVSELVLEPGASIGHHVHENETEVFIVTQGRARFLDDDQPIEAGPGDVLVTHSGHGHSVENTGDETFRMIAVIVLE